MFWNVGLVLQIIGFILLLFVDIIVGLVMPNQSLFLLLISYTIFVLALLIGNLVSYYKEYVLEEDERLLKLKMNHSLTLSLLLMTISLGLILDLNWLYKFWYLYLIFLSMFIIGVVLFTKSYYLRYKSLERRIKNEKRRSEC